MKKEIKRGYILIALVFLIYVTATVPFPKTAIYWIAFGFCVVAFLAQIWTMYAVTRKQKPVGGRIYDYPTVRISVRYLAVQFVVSLLLMRFCEKLPVYVATLIEVVILAVAVIGFISVEAARTEVIRQDTQLGNELVWMQELQNRMSLLIGQCEEGQIKEILRKTAEEIRYSNPVSVEVSGEIEKEIEILFTEIEAVALDEDVENVAGLCDRMTGLLRERDRICKHR